MEKHFSKNLVLTIMMILLNYGVTIAQDYSDSQTSKPPSAFKINLNDKGHSSLSAQNNKPRAQEMATSLLEMSKSSSIFKKEKDLLPINVQMNNNKILREGEGGYFLEKLSPSDLYQTAEVPSNIDVGYYPESLFK